MSDLTNLKKGDSVAVVRTGGSCRPTSASKAVVVKKNPASVLISHQGKEHKVNLQGQGLGYGEWVEPWDDARELGRVREAQLFEAREALNEVEGLVRLLPRDILTPEDVVREPEKFAEIKRLRAIFQMRLDALCKEIVQTRTP